MTSHRPAAAQRATSALADLLRGPVDGILADLLDASPDGVAIFDRAGDILAVNRALLDMYGATNDALVGQPSSELLATRFQDPQRIAAFFADPHAYELGLEQELCGAHADGTEFPIELRLTPLRTANGPLVRATIRDASERRREEAELRDAYARAQEATDQLRELDRMKAEFISNASHELRTPLTVVMGFARMLAGRWDTLDDATRIHLVKRIAASGQRLEGLIADMVDFTRAEAGRIDVTLDELPLDELAHDAAFKISSLLDGHSLRVDIPPGIVVRADRSITGRIFENLLTNAVRTSPDGTNIVIDVVDPGAADEITVRVVDDGPGIPEAERERVFDRYHSADAGSAHGLGMGIGLAITKAFAEAQGGRTWLGADDACGCSDGGNCFCFTVQRAVSP